MMVEYFGTEFDIPDLLIEKFEKEFEALPGSAYREGVYQLRNTIDEILDIVAEEPEILHEREYLSDFLRALAMRKALEKHGILYDA